jgi:hypothetical protein
MYGFYGPHFTMAASSTLASRGQAYLINPEWLEPVMDCIKMSMQPVSNPCGFLPSLLADADVTVTGVLTQGGPCNQSWRSRERALPRGNGSAAVRVPSRNAR